MHFAQILLGVTLAVLLSSPFSHAWGDEDQQLESGFVEPPPGIEDFRGPVEQTWNQQRRLEEDSEVPLREIYKDAPNNGPLPYSSRSISGRRLRSSEGWKQKRYMGMEIPEYITKNDGSRVEPPQRGTKQKMLNSG